MTRPRPALDGVDPVHADGFARGRVLAWRRTCRGPERTARLSVVRCADLNSGDRAAEDVAWWEGAAVLQSRDHQGWRIDVALRLLAAQDGAPVVGVWARPGPAELAQSDLGWSAAVRHAAADRAMPAPSLLVVTRWGWLCLPAGTSRRWKRPRATG